MKEFYEEVVPDQGEEESQAEARAGIRLRSLFLLRVLFMPIILTVIEILTGFFSDTITPTILPTPTLYGLGHF